MIPTVYKNKLPKTLSYPAGAQMITDALSEVPQFEELSLWFTWHRYKSDSREGRSVCITARYTNSHLGLSASRKLEEAGFYGPSWQITVQAVERSHSSKVRSALRDHGLAMLKDWLSEPRTETWLSTSHDFLLRFCPERERLSSESI